MISAASNCIKPFIYVIDFDLCHLFFHFHLYSTHYDFRTTIVKFLKTNPAVMHRWDKLKETKSRV